MDSESHVVEIELMQRFELDWSPEVHVPTLHHTGVWIDDPTRVDCPIDPSSLVEMLWALLHVNAELS